MVFFEATHRIEETLADMVTAFGAERPAAVCRELTKTYEEVVRGPLGELVGAYKGEITVVVAGSPMTKPDEGVVKAELAELVQRGLSKRDAAAEVAQRHGLSKRDVYQLTLEGGG